MRILIFCNKLPYPKRDGGAVAIHNMVRGYHEAGADVTVLALNTHKHYYPPDAIPEEDVLKQIKLRTVIVDTGITVAGAIRNGLSKAPYHATRFHQQQVEEALVAILKEKAFDIVQVEEIHLSSYNSLIRAYTDAMLILRAHNVEHAIWQGVTRQIANPLKKAYLHLQTRRLQAFEQNHLNDFDAILPITKADETSFRQMGFTGPVRTTPVGLPLADYPPAAQHEPGKLVFHLGAMDWLPNQRAVVWLLEEVWPLVLEAMPEAQLALAGRGMSDNYANAAVSQVQLYGEVPDAKAFMRKGDIMVVPLHAGSGMRIKILEGMAMEKAIVTTSLGASGVQVKNGHDVLIANQAQAFANCILRCLKYPAYQQALGKKARKTVAKHYDLGHLAAQALEFLKSCKPQYS